MKVMNLLMEIAFSGMTHLLEILAAGPGKMVFVLNVHLDSTSMRKKYAPRLTIFVGHGVKKMVIVCLAMEDTNWTLVVACLPMSEETQARMLCVLHLRREHVYNVLSEPILMRMEFAWKLILNAELSTT